MSPKGCMTCKHTDLGTMGWHLDAQSSCEESTRYTVCSEQELKAKLLQVIHREEP